MELLNWSNFTYKSNFQVLAEKTEKNPILRKSNNHNTKMLLKAWG
jgi:hypothetical protein